MLTRQSAPRGSLPKSVQRLSFVLPLSGMWLAEIDGSRNANKLHMHSCDLALGQHDATQGFRGRT